MYTYTNTWVKVGTYVCACVVVCMHLRMLVGMQVGMYACMSVGQAGRHMCVCVTSKYVSMSECRYVET